MLLTLIVWFHHIQGHVQRREILIPKPTEGHFGVGFPNKNSISSVVDWASMKTYTHKLYLIIGPQLKSKPGPNPSTYYHRSHNDFDKEIQPLKLSYSTIIDQKPPAPLLPPSFLHIVKPTRCLERRENTQRRRRPATHRKHLRDAPHNLGHQQKQPMFRGCHGDFSVSTQLEGGGPTIHVLTLIELHMLE